jgi:hypothetical protein
MNAEHDTDTTPRKRKRGRPYKTGPHSQTIRVPGELVHAIKETVKAFREKKGNGE